MSKRQHHTAKPVIDVMVNSLHVLKNLFIYNSTFLFISKLTHKIQEIQSTSGYVRFETIFYFPGECINFCLLVWGRGDGGAKHGILPRQPSMLLI
jgi:hypothetical protein